MIDYIIYGTLNRNCDDCNKPKELQHIEINGVRGMKCKDCLKFRYGIDFGGKNDTNNNNNNN